MGADLAGAQSSRRAVCRAAPAHWLPGDGASSPSSARGSATGGLAPPLGKIQQRQKVAARARTNQREEDLALRRILVAHLFKLLPLRLRKKPSSAATAQAIIGRLEEALVLIERKPPITVRTIQEDIRFMRKNRILGM